MADDTPKTLIEKIKDNLPGIIPILVVLGYLDIHFYYNYFGIDIYPYLDAAEIIFAFASMLVVTIPILFYIGLLVIKVSEEGGISINPIAIYILVSIICLPALGAVVLALLEIEVIETDSWRKEIYIGIGFLAIIGLFWGVNEIIDRKMKKNSAKTFLTIKMIIFLFIFVGFTYVLALIKARKVIKGSPKYYVELVRSLLPSINSDSNLVYIGSSKNYIFLRNISTGENQIIPRASVIEFKETRQRIGL